MGMDSDGAAVPMTEDVEVRLADYRAPDWLIEDVSLHFNLSPMNTRVKARLTVKRNPEFSGTADFRLHGQELRLISAEIDGVAVEPVVEGEGLTVSANDLPEAGFIWTCEVEIDPETNTSLNGLYMSNGMYCTQCEAEGFRKITYYPDRPDVMATFFVRVEADAPVLLSNGDPVASGITEDGRRFAEWNDPWPKPAYLFALVAGDLVAHRDEIVTMSGRKVSLGIYVRPGDETRCDYAMDALKRSMVWDEEVYGREYDLDHFNIVAVDDFNMGAMENKGLNIFNSKYVLATPDTATDDDYGRIEAIIAHEYFHNWTGNRITCRDWFQLCLKEGLTVYRDQQFSGDMRSHAVKRIQDVQTLRARQFREDAGPLAHPVRPAAYIEINNFYTATVYEKGAELIGMLRRIVGPEGYDKALQLYFDRHDGQACTIEDWIGAFQDATGEDLSHFAQWYGQAGTPRIGVEEAFADGVYSLTLTQKTRPTPGQEAKAAMDVPVAYGFLGSDGAEIGTPGVLRLTEAKQVFRFDLPEKPVLSLFREFSAPVIVERDIAKDEQAFLLAHDSDAFNKWEAGRNLVIAEAIDLANGTAEAPSQVFVDAMAAVAGDDGLDNAFKALLLNLPGVEEVSSAIAGAGGVVDPDRVLAGIEQIGDAIAAATADAMNGIYAAMSGDAAYAPDAESAGRRALRTVALHYISRLDGGETARAQFDAADNMTDSLAALRTLSRRGLDGADMALAQFASRWHDDELVMDKWLALQATSLRADTLNRVTALSESDDFNWRNPNRFRSLIAAFAMANPVRFHAADGEGYRFYGDWLIRMDDLNPQTAARCAGAFETWRNYDERRQAHARAALETVLAKPNLSKDLNEMASRILAG
ncbi:MAG: aminopeptidase N [Pikeienuella sp.]